jgi:hypothetical protein
LAASFAIKKKSFMTLVAGVHLQAVGLEDDLKETPEIC